MYDLLNKNIGVIVQDTILAFADLLKDDGTPGIFACVLILAAACVAIKCWVTCSRQCQILKAFLDGIKAEERDGTSADRGEKLTARLNESRKLARATPIKNAWDEFRETLVIADHSGETVTRNTVRPSTFFNTEELGYGIAGYRIAPGLFVSIGLSLTFLGLIAALHSMSHGEITATTMQDLLKLASAKFIMSLTGLLCSIALTLLFSRLSSKIEKSIAQIVHSLEGRFTFISLEEIALDQLKAQAEAQKVQRELGFELVAELGRPLREDVPRAISASITESMQPILDKMSQQGTDNMSQMANDLSEKMSGGVERALSIASDRIAQAGDRIAKLSDRMDTSTGKMGSEMDRTIVRMAEAVEGLQSALQTSAQSTQNAFSEGASSLLSVMNNTLQTISDNTGAGARAMVEAAGEMRKAADGMRQDIEAAAREGAASMQARLEDATGKTSSALGQAGAVVLSRVEATTEKMGNQLDEAIMRVAQSVDALNGAMTVQAKETAGAFSTGADHLLSTMNTTLESIRDNTGAGARAMSLAAEDMKQAATAMREEMEAAARNGAEAARSGLEAASVVAAQAIDAAGQSVFESFEAASSKIGTLSNDLMSKAQSDLFSPMTEASEQLASVSRILRDGAQAGETMADNLRSGADAGRHAAEEFRNASVEFTTAARPVREAADRIETSTRALSESTSAVATTVIKSAENVTQSAAQTLDTAQAALGAQRRAIENALDGVSELVRRMQGQGDKLDEIDIKLGRAFELYAERTEAAMQAIRSHVVDMAEGMNTALDTLRAVVDQLQDFRPQQGRNP